MTLPVLGSVLSDVIIWTRRIIKSPSDQSISDQTILDYINRFYIYEMPERLQLFELKRQYTFETQRNIFMYQAPFFFDDNGVNTGIPMYQTFRPPAYADGIEMGYYQSNDQFYRIFPEFVQNVVPFQGDGTAGPYTTTLSRTPILRGFTDDLDHLEPYVFVTGVDATGTQQYIVDDGEGLLLNSDSSLQPIIVGGDPDEAGTVDYVTGEMTFEFNQAIPSTNDINIQSSPFSSGFPRLMQFFNNIFKLYPVPDRPYKIQIDANITPAQFLDSASSVPFAYMSEYFARGAARKILTDNADYDQFAFYEPLFREQENLVLRRTTRQRAVERTPTIFSAQTVANPYTNIQY